MGDAGAYRQSSDALAVKLAALKARAAAPRDPAGFAPPPATYQAAPAGAGGPPPEAYRSPTGDYAEPAYGGYAPSPIPPSSASPIPPAYSPTGPPGPGYGAPAPPPGYGMGAPSPYPAGLPRDYNPMPATDPYGAQVPPMGPPGGYQAQAANLPPQQYGGYVPAAAAAARPPGDVNSRANDLLRAVRGNLSIIENTRKRVQSVDIAFLIDCTGSMQHWIDRTKDTVMDILDRLKGLYPEAQLRTAFVGYRDFEPKDNNTSSYVVEQFMPPEYLKERIALVTAKGGDDVAEDVIGGLAKIPNLDWQGKARVMIHIADAPPHGHRFHLGRYSDRFASSADPNGKKPTDFEGIIRQIVNKQVDYFFFKCHAATDIFEAEMRENIYKRWFPGCKFEVIALASDDKAEFLEKIMTATRSSMRGAGMN